MVLMRAGGNWYLCTGVDRDKGVIGARCGAAMPHPAGFTRPRPESRWVWGTLPLDQEGVVFYPTLTWRGHAVHADAWKAESDDPILSCKIYSLSVGDATQRGRARADAAWEQANADIQRDRWTYYPHEGWHRWCHVDELTKVSGPPPGIRA